MHTLGPGRGVEGWVVEHLGVLAIPQPPVVSGPLGKSRFSALKIRCCHLGSFSWVWPGVSQVWGCRPPWLLRGNSQSPPPGATVMGELEPGAER